MRRVGLAGILALLLLSAGLALGAPVAGANSTLGGFEIDGNLVDNSGPGDPIDWATPPPNLTTFTDLSGNKDDGFAMGSKELDPANWACTIASAPGKDDIVGGQIAFRRVPATTGHQYAYVDFTRKAVNGDAHVDYEFNKSGTGVNASCGGLPKRTPGDVLIAFDTNNGGATIDVVAYTWDGSNFVADAHAANNAAGAVNIPNTITGHTAGDFGEASIDLTNAIGEINCGEFSGVYMKTRSSTSLTASLQDYTKRQPLNIGECPASTVAKTQRDATTDTTGSAFTANPITASPGDFIEYQLTYKNTGPGIAHSVMLSDTLNGAYTLSTCDGCTAAGQALTWSLGDVGPGGTVTKTVRAQLTGPFAAGAATTVTNAASAATHEDQASSNTVSLTVATPKSGLKKEVRDVTTNGTFAATAVASPGDTLEYRLTYANTGPGAVSGASVTDTIDARTSFSPNPPTCTGCSVTGSTLTWNVGTVAGGSTSSPTTKSVTFQVKLASTGFAAGSSTDVTNTAAGTSTGEPPTTSTTTTTVRTPNSSSVKQVRNVTAGVTTFATTAKAKPGDVLEYKLVYTNAGPGIATGVVVSDPLAAKQTPIASSCSPACTVSGSTVSWTLGTVAPGSTTLIFRVTLDSSFPAGDTQLANVAVTRSTGETPPDSPPTTTTVTATPGSTIAKAVRDVTTGGGFGTTADASPGDTIEYRITYANTGDAPVTGVGISDVVAAGSTYTPTCTGGCTYDATTKTLSWAIGSVAAKAPPTVLTFQVRLDSSFPAGTTTTVRNTATVDTDQEAPKTSDETTVSVKTPDSSTVKQVRDVTTNGAFATTTAASPGDTIEYQLVYTNNGPGTATGETVTDTLAAMQTFVAGSCTVTSGTTCAFAAPKVTWTIGSVPSGGTKTLTFRVTLDSAFPSGSTPVQNAAVYSSDQEPPATTPPTTVTVAANPRSATAKAVRDVTTNGTFATTATAKPGNVLEYQLTYTNTGNAPATGTVVTDTLTARQTYVPSSCTTLAGTCTVASPNVTWTIGTVAAGATKTLTFRVTLDSTFPSSTTTVKNTAVTVTDQEPPSTSNETTVTVLGTPKLTLHKDADKTSVAAGDQITYTLTYGNTGDSAAGSSVVTEVVPTGTSFVSCTGSCAVTGSTVTWNVGTVSPGDTGNVKMTVQVRPDIDACAVCNVATIASPDQAAGPTSSNQVCAAAQPGSDPSTANANGDALGLRAYVPLLGVPLVNQNISHAASTQTSVGVAADHDRFASLDILGVVGLTSVAKADVLTTTSSSQVTKALGAQQSTVSEVLGLNVLSGVVTADTVRSVAATSASGTASSYSAAGTTLTNLKVLGSSVVNPTPGLKIPLDNNLVNKALYGKGSYVAINEQTGSTSSPASGQLSGGTYKADLTVTAVRVYLTGGTIGGLLTAGGPPVEITVAKSAAHAEHKQTWLCNTSPNNAVSGHAFIASAQVDPLVPTATVGFVDIPASGGAAHKDVPASLLPADGSVVTTGIAASDSTGSNGATASTSSSYAQAAGVCLLKLVSSACLVKADLVRSQSNSTASAAARSSDATGTQFVNLVVAGVPIAGTPPPNTTIPLPLGLGYVVLNEQTPDAPETGHTGLTVRAIHIKVTTAPLAPLVAGAEVIVAEAHSDALWR